MAQIPGNRIRSGLKERQKCAFCTLLGALSGIGGNTPLFVQINVFAVWALRLDWKYTTRWPLWAYIVSELARKVRKVSPAQQIKSDKSLLGRTPKIQKRTKDKSNNEP